MAAVIAEKTGISESADKVLDTKLKSSQILDWQKLYVELGVEDCFPTLKFAEILKSTVLSNEVVTELDFTGIQQLTDEAFVALRKVLLKTKLKETIRKVNCTGCSHVTDFGVDNLAQALPFLSQVILDGCHKLTSLSLVSLISHCTQLKNISALACSITWLPRKVPEGVMLFLDGCPLLPMDDSLLESNYHPTQKMVILTHWYCSVDIVKFFTKEDADIQFDNSDNGKPKFDYYPNVKLNGVTRTFNIFELQGLIGLHSLLADPECVFVIALDISGPQANKHPQLHIMNRISYIKAQAPYAGVIILGLHSNATRQESESQMADLGKSVMGYLKQQAATMEEHLLRDSYDSESAKSRDFQTQQRYCKSMMSSNFLCSVTFFAVNRDTKQVLMKWPIERQPSVVSRRSSVVRGVNEENEAKMTLKAKRLNELERAKMKLAGINKSDIAELRSVKRPTVIMEQTVCAMVTVITNGAKQRESINFRDAISNYTFLSDMINCNLEEIREDIIMEVKKIMGENFLSESQDEQVKSCGQCLASIHQWLKAVYSYATECLLEERMQLEVRRQQQERRQKKHDRESKSQGPKAIFTVIEKLVGRVFDQHYPERKIRHKAVNVIQQVEEILKESVEKCLITFEELRSMLLHKNNFFVTMPNKALTQILDWLQIEGKILWLPHVENQPLIVNIQWFVRIVNKIRITTFEIYQKNGKKFQSLAPDTPLLNQEMLINWLTKEISFQSAAVFWNILMSYGLLLPVPETATLETNNHDNSIFFMRELLSEKPFLRTGLEEGMKSSLQFKEKVWPQIGTPAWHQSDVNVGVLFSFTSNMPANILSRIMAEWILIGDVISIWQTGCIARCGATEIILLQDVHGAKVSNSIYAEARLTRGWMSEVDHSVLSAYIWGSLSKYVLVIESIINEYPTVHVAISMPCMGGCTQQGTSAFFPITEIPRNNTQKLQCNFCEESQQMSAHEVGYLTGRQYFLPFHDYKPLYGGLNLAGPYSKSLAQTLIADDNAWACSYCGMPRAAALRTWAKECQLYPSCTINGFESLGKSEENVVNQMGNVISMGKDGGKKKRLPCKLFLCKEPLFSSGLTRIDVTVLEPGPIVLTVGKHSWSKKNPDKIDLGQCYLEHDFLTGKIKDQQILSNSDNELPVLQGVTEAVSRGDTVTLEIIGEETIEVTDRECTEVKQTKIVLRTVLRKNDRLFYSTCIPYSSVFGLLLQASGDSTSKVILEAPSFPHVRATHFPLHSTVLCKTGVGNQWIIGHVVGTNTEGIQIRCDPHGDSGVSKEFLCPVSSPDLLPVGQYSGGMTILLGKDVMKNKDQLVKFLKESRALPAPFGLFKHIHQSINDQFMNLRISNHEPRFCVQNGYCAEVLEQSYLHFMETDGKSQKQQQTWSVVLLPSSVALSTLLNPMRHTAHDWDHQDIYFICRGSEWSFLTSYQRDSHFLDTAAVPIPREMLADFMRHYLSLMVLAYFNMRNRETILPFLSTIFPNFDSVIGKKELLESLSQLMFLYQSTFLLFRCADLSGKKRQQKDAYGSFQESLRAVITAVHGDNQRLLQSLQNPGICETHSLVRKKANLADIGLGVFTEQENVKELQYSSCVLHLEASSCIRDGKLPLSLLSMQKMLNKLILFFPNLQGINLSFNEVDSLTGISACVSLKHLIVHGNQLKELPEEMTKLRDSIMTLDFSSGPLSALPDFICDFRNLRQLKLGFTIISELPKHIGNLTRLRMLDLASCPISVLPESFRRLRSLESLQLQGVPTVSSHVLKDSGTVFTKAAFRKLASCCSAYSIVSKEELDIIWNQCNALGTNILGSAEIMALNEKLFWRFPRFGMNDREKMDNYGGFPPQIFNLYRLRTLNISYQAVRFVPSEIKRLSRLTVLILADNPLLEVVCGEVGQCNVLNLDNCPMLKTPPKEIRDQGMKTVMAYLRRLSQGSKACYQTKMMIVGLGGVGKTSLVRALLSADLRTSSTENEGITNGIAISNWSVKQANRMLTFSIWDFAGQTVYYNTHQFFLSHRAIYLLAWNMRHGYEHAGLDFWLSSIACHCPNAPVIVIGTHADQISDPVLPKDQFLKKFPNIVGFFDVSAITGQGVKALMERLVEVTMQQPYIGEMVPEAWLSLERAILSKRNQTSLLDWNNIERLAQSAGIYGVEVKQAVYFLHDLGTLQYFDNDLLRDKVIINPQWIVDVMACLVSANNKFCKDGRLSHKDIGSVWKGYPKDLHKWLLRLTEYFDLTFPISDKARSIIPCLLPPKEPQIHWPEEQISDGIKETKVSYTFKYLPAGLFNRAQVRLYEFSDNSVIWKTGSLLLKNDHYALLTQIGDNKIQVKVIGLQSDNIVLMLHEVIEGLISKFYTGINYKYEIPCPSCLQANSKSLAMLSSKVLRRALEMKPLFLQCHKHFHTLSAVEVQNAILPQSTQEFDIQLQRGMIQLASYKEELTYDLFFMYSQADVPLEGQDETKLHPYRVYLDLMKEGYKCWYVDDLHQRSTSDVAEAIQNSRLVLVFISDSFVNNPLCQRMFQFAKDSLKREFILLMVGTGREWQKSQIGLQVSSIVYVNLQNIRLYDERILTVLDQTRQKLKPNEDEPAASDVFISYCWLNSNAAVEAGDCRLQEGAVGRWDPRLIKEFLEKAGISCWLDVEKVGRTGLFADIADGMKASRIIVACISDEYARSENCKMEFRFAHISLKKPIILTVVGTGFEWESTEVGMLSLGYKKINFQVENKVALEILLQSVYEILASVHCMATVKNQEQHEKAFKELFEAVQRKFFRQLGSYVLDEEPFPHLFTIDFKDQPFDIFSLQGADSLSAAVNLDEVEDFDGIDDASDVPGLKQNQFSLKFLCEYEGGWHCVGEGFAFQLNRDDMITLLELAASYFTRMLSILNLTNLDLEILRSKEGKKLLKMMKSWDNIENQQHIRPIYLALRQFLQRKDKHRMTGSLKRCYMPSGKHLWLCEEHQLLPRVMILSDNRDEVLESEDESEDNALIKALTLIHEEKNSVSAPVTMDESLKLKVLKVTEYIKGLSLDSSPQNKNTLLTAESSAVDHEKSKRSNNTLAVDETKPPPAIENPKKHSQNPAKEPATVSPMRENITSLGKEIRVGSPSFGLKVSERLPRRSETEEKRLNTNIIGLASAARYNGNALSSTACILL